MLTVVSSQMSEELVWELFTQAGPVGVSLPSLQCQEGSMPVWPETRSLEYLPHNFGYIFADLLRFA